MPLPLLAAGEFDPIQIAIVVLFVIGGFIKWLWENWQAKREEDRQERPVDPEERRLREEAWRRQTGQPPRAPSAPPAAPDAWGELRKAWHELKEAARQGQQPAAPPAPAQPPPLRRSAAPPPPPPAQRGRVREVLTAAEERLAAAKAERDRRPAQPEPAQALPVSLPVTMVEKRQPSPFLAALQNLRGNPALMRQAIVMHEVLGPPKALQSSGDTAI